jgi:hypothetical protein
MRRRDVTGGNRGRSTPALRRIGPPKEPGSRIAAFHAKSGIALQPPMGHKAAHADDELLEDPRP